LAKKFLHTISGQQHQGLDPLLNKDLAMGLVKNYGEMLIEKPLYPKNFCKFLSA
jgi:hypothetical protein